MRVSKMLKFGKREREREREREKEREIERERERPCIRDSTCMCVRDRETV